MKTYLVGGAVRDHLLGKEVSDRDYVVVGATVDEMLKLGFEKVGASFPVFLHPITREEYALARREKKTGPGYHGFSCEFGPDVTLETDCQRRDLTINAMAMDPETGEIIDPFGGQEDLKNKVLRHTSDAFIEDPIRILRIFRFAAKYHFKIHPYTQSLIQSFAHTLNEIHTNRMIAEFDKALSLTCYDSVTRFFQLCLIFELDKKVKLLHGMHIPETIHFSTDNMNTLGNFWGTCRDKPLPEKLQKSAEWFRQLSLLNKYHTTAEELHDFIQKFRLTQYQKGQQESFYWSTMMCNINYNWIRQGVSAFIDVPIPEDGFDVGNRLKWARIAAIEKMLKKYNT